MGTVTRSGWGIPRAQLALLLLAAVLLPACNLRPLNSGASGAATRQELAQVEVQPLSGRDGQILRNYLIDELNPAGLAAAPAYTLAIQTDTAENALLIQLDDTITRFDLSYAAEFQLQRKADGAVLYRSAVRRVASYNVRGEPFATRVASQDAERRAAREVSREIGTRLSLYFAAREP